MLMLALACTSDEPHDSPEDSEGFCHDAPHVTWANYGEGLILENCQPCHASTAEDRKGAPEDVTFDDYEETLAWKERILVRSIGDDGGMPPSRPLLDIDQEMLLIWLTCWED